MSDEAQVSMTVRPRGRFYLCVPHDAASFRRSTKLVVMEAVMEDFDTVRPARVLEAAEDLEFKKGDVIFHRTGSMLPKLQLDPTDSSKVLLFIADDLVVGYAEKSDGKSKNNS